ncbi:MAG: hypothetical protein K0S71_587 [Clostridia bacterium]|jgi:hypothetical protein|nr:hypothetical protein [Clostridia bacterium]
MIRKPRGIREAKIDIDLECVVSNCIELKDLICSITTIKDLQSDDAVVLREQLRHVMKELRCDTFSLDKELKA